LGIEHEDSPITSVNHALANTNIIVAVIKIKLGPSPSLQVIFANRCMSHFIGIRMNKAQAIAKRTMYNAVIPVDALTSATERARSVHPTISFPTPAERTQTPTVVSRSLSSVRILQSTGKAVIEYATQQNNIK
jgi:hypothetical protein